MTSPALRPSPRGRLCPFLVPCLKGPGPWSDDRPSKETKRLCAPSPPGVPRLPGPLRRPAVHARDVGETADPPRERLYPETRERRGRPGVEACSPGRPQVDSQGSALRPAQRVRGLPPVAPPVPGRPRGGEAGTCRLPRAGRPGRALGAPGARREWRPSTASTRPTSRARRTRSSRTDLEGRAAGPAPSFASAPRAAPGSPPKREAWAPRPAEPRK